MPRGASTDSSSDSSPSATRRRRSGRRRRRRSRHDVSSSDSDTGGRTGRRKVRAKRHRGASSVSSDGGETSRSPSSASSLDEIESRAQELAAERDRILSTRFGYSDEANPFNDRSLSRPFVWKKKEILLRAAGRKSAALRRPEDVLLRTEKKIEEIERVKRRREEREAEQKLLQEQQALLAREREAENYADWAAREELFHQDMARRRTDIRLQEGRYTSIDVVAKIVRVAYGDITSNTHATTVIATRPPPPSPCKMMEKMGEKELRSLIREIQEQHDLCLSALEYWSQTPNDDGTASTGLSNWATLMEKSATGGGNNGGDKKLEAAPALSRDTILKHLKYWAALIIASTHIHQERTTEGGGLKGSRDVQSGISRSVMEDITKLLGGKTEEELRVLEERVKSKIKSIKTNTLSDEDLTYWETIVAQLPYFYAVAEINKVYDTAIRISCNLAAARKGMEEVPREPPNPDQGGGGSCDVSADATVSDVAGSGDADCAAPAAAAIFRVDLTPALVRISDVEKGKGVVLSLESYLALRQESRRQLTAQQIERVKRARLAELELKQRALERKQSLLPTAEGTAGSLPKVQPPALALMDTGKEIFERFVREERCAMGEDEYVMTPASEVPVGMGVGSKHPSSVPLGGGSCAGDSSNRLGVGRKPSFFNRVKTGYEWTKYNQSHFDRDNPPPKAVQGYKLNLFYPDLIDKTKAPLWKLLPSDTPDTILIRFSSGPPYEDICFKIVNREWDLNPRRGFRNTFDRGILQLHFNFKRYRYRK